MAAEEKWYFTKAHLANTPSRKCGVDADKELSYRQQAANFIQDMGQRLQVSQLCINTAIVYMHRFYMFHSFTQFHRNSIAAAALFLAAKVEEQPRKLEHVIKVAHICLHRDQAPLDTKSEQYLEQAQELVVNENILLQTLGFDVAIDHPHTHVVRCCHLVRELLLNFTHGVKSIPSSPLPPLPMKRQSEDCMQKQRPVVGTITTASKDLAQTSYFMASNSLHLTTMCLQYKPTIVACFCIHLACKWSNWEIPRSNEGKDWFWYVDKAVTQEQLEELTAEFLAIFDKCPSKLKKKVMSISANQSTSFQHSLGYQLDFEPRKIKTGEGSQDGPAFAQRAHHTHMENKPSAMEEQYKKTRHDHAQRADTYREYREKKERERLERERTAAAAAAATTTASSRYEPVETVHTKLQREAQAHSVHSKSVSGRDAIAVREGSAREQQANRDVSSRDKASSSRETNIREQQSVRDASGREQSSIRDMIKRESGLGRESVKREPTSMRDLSKHEQPLPRDNNKRDSTVGREVSGRDQVQPRTSMREQISLRDSNREQAPVCDVSGRMQVSNHDLHQNVEHEVNHIPKNGLEKQQNHELVFPPNNDSMYIGGHKSVCDKHKDNYSTKDMKYGSSNLIQDNKVISHSGSYDLKRVQNYDDLRHKGSSDRNVSDKNYKVSEKVLDKTQRRDHTGDVKLKLETLSPDVKTRMEAPSAETKVKVEPDIKIKVEPPPSDFKLKLEVPNSSKKVLDSKQVESRPDHKYRREARNEQSTEIKPEPKSELLRDHTDGLRLEKKTEPKRDIPYIKCDLKPKTDERLDVGLEGKVAIKKESDESSMNTKPSIRYDQPKSRPVTITPSSQDKHGHPHHIKTKSKSPSLQHSKTKSPSVQAVRKKSPSAPTKSRSPHTRSKSPPPPPPPPFPPPPKTESAAQHFLRSVASPGVYSSLKSDSSVLVTSGQCAMPQVPIVESAPEKRPQIKLTLPVLNVDGSKPTPEALHGALGHTDSGGKPPDERTDLKQNFLKTSPLLLSRERSKTPEKGRHAQRSPGSQHLGTKLKLRSPDKSKPTAIVAPQTPTTPSDPSTPSTPTTPGKSCGTPASLRSRRRTTSSSSEPELVPVIKKLDDIPEFHSIRDGAMGIKLPGRVPDIIQPIRDRRLPSSDEESKVVSVSRELQPPELIKPFSEASVKVESCPIDVVIPDVNVHLPSPKKENNETKLIIPIMPEKHACETHGKRNSEHHRSDKKKKKDKHKHKEKEKHKDKEERKHKHKHRDKDKQREKDRLKAEHGSMQVTAPIRITIPKDKLNMTVSSYDQGSSLQSESSNHSLKLKIPRERLKGNDSTSGSPQNSVANMTSGLKIKISKDVIENFNSGKESRKRDRSPRMEVDKTSPASKMARAADGSSRRSDLEKRSYEQNGVERKSRQFQSPGNKVQQKVDSSYQYKGSSGCLQ